MVASLYRCYATRPKAIPQLVCVECGREAKLYCDACMLDDESREVPLCGRASCEEAHRRKEDLPWPFNAGPQT